MYHRVLLNLMYLPWTCSIPHPCWAWRYSQRQIFFVALSFRLLEWQSPWEYEVYWLLAIASASVSYSTWRLAASQAD